MDLAGGLVSVPARGEVTGKPRLTRQGARHKCQDGTTLGSVCKLDYDRDSIGRYG